MATECGGRLILPIFGSVSALSFNADFPAHLDYPQHFDKDFKHAHAFLFAYKDNKATYNAYRREIERLLHWSWQKQNKRVVELKRGDIEAFIKFCQKPPKSWIGLNKPTRFIMRDGRQEPNPDWRPFVVSLSKSATHSGCTPDRANYHLSDKAIQAIFAILSSFFQFLIQESYAEVNPVLQIRQKTKFIRREQGGKKIRRLTSLQWSFVLETAEEMAQNNTQYERTLFIVSSLYLMYLRVSELAASERWIPQMNDFKRDHDGLWWFTTVGKGNKQRQIAVSEAMLNALKRWRRYLRLPALPSPDDQSPLIPSLRGHQAIASTNQIRNIVQHCFDLAVERMVSQGLEEEVGDLRAATVHWLRHTGISDDVKRRPREHVRDDAGHSSSQTTDHYIDIDKRERHQSALKKPLISD